MDIYICVYIYIYICAGSGAWALAPGLGKCQGQLTSTCMQNSCKRNSWGSIASQRSLHNAPIFRLLLKVAVNGTHQCDFLNFCGSLGSQRVAWHGLEAWSSCEQQSVHGTHQFKHEQHPNHSAWLHMTIPSRPFGYDQV
jgi:hypothetical protein